MRRFQIFFFVAAVLCVEAIRDDGVEGQWQEYREKYNESYVSPVEQSRRFAIFSHNLEKIEEHNKEFSDGKRSFKDEVDEFTDWTDEEFKEYVSHGLINEGDIVSSLTDEDEEINEEWKTFKEIYKKSYRSPVETQKRFQIFKSNFIKMQEHNDLRDQGLVSDTVEINQFSDWTQEEFRDYVNRGILPTDGDIIRRWNEFKQKFLRTYESIPEAEKRFNIFKANVKLIDEHNALYNKGESTYFLGITQFTDWTNEEYQEWVRTH